MEFLENRLEFTGRDFIDFLLKRGYAVQTAYNWLHRLQIEGLIYVSRVNRNIKIYRSRVYEEKHEIPPYKVVP